MERNLLVTPGRGLELTNQAGGKVLNNTLISTGNGDYGIKVSNLSTPVMRNNIVQGYQTGMQIDNDLMNTNVSHNALWNISGEQYTGTAWRRSFGRSAPSTPTRTARTCTATSTWIMFVGADSPQLQQRGLSLHQRRQPLYRQRPRRHIADIGEYYFDGPFKTSPDPITVTFTVDGSVLLEDSGSTRALRLRSTASSIPARLRRRFQCRGQLQLGRGPRLPDRVGEVRLPASGAWRLHVEQRHDAEPGDDAARLCSGGVRRGVRHLDSRLRVPRDVRRCGS